MAGPQPNQLVKMLRESKEVITALERHDIRELFKKMFQMCLVPASQKHLFNSLDLDRLDSELKVRYLLRLVCVKIREDGRVWDKFLKLLTKMGDQELSENLSKQYTHKSGHQLESKQGYEAIVFGLQDVKLLLGLLVEVSHKWERVGLALDLPKYKIEACRGNDNVISLSNILTCWMSADDNIPAKTSLSRLKKALCSDIVGESRIALNLEKEVKKAKQTDTTVLSKEVDSKPLLSIVYQSYDTEVADGRATLLFVQASLTKPVSYQWNKDGEPLANCSSYCGVEEDILVITSARQGVEGNYTCCVSYQEQKVASNDITLTVLYTPTKKCLLNLYSAQSEVPEDYWPPVGTKTFINLVLIKLCKHYKDSNHYVVPEDADKVIAQKEIIEYSEVFGEYKSSELVLVEGRPGSGKTTLVHKIIKDWTSGQVLREADLVFLITLRFFNVSTDDESPSNLYRQLHYKDEELKAFSGDIEKQHGERICFIVDGLEDYHCQDRDSSIVYQLLDKRYLSKSMVIVTCRPDAVVNLYETLISKRIETFGFIKEQINEYFDNFPFANSPLEPTPDCSYSSRLKKYLCSHPSVFHMCFLPVHAAMISFLYQLKGGNIPATQTKIYEEFTRSMILRHLRRQDKGIKISSLKELKVETKKHFDTLCFLAYVMSTRKVQVISREELSREFSLDVSSDDSWSLGLVTVNSTAQLSGMDKLYTFLHLTFQEFLSAYYIASLDIEKQVELLRPSVSVRLSTAVTTFLCGLVNFEGKDILLFELFSKREYPFFTSLSMAFESQQQIVCDYIMKESNDNINFNWHLSTLELACLNYVTATTSIRIKAIAISSGTLARTFQNIHKNIFIHMQTLNINEVVGNAADLAALVDALRICRNLKKLKVHLRELSTNDALRVADAFYHLTSLQELKLKCSMLSKGITSLLSGLQNIPGLKLKLKFSNLGQGSVQELAGLKDMIPHTCLSKLAILNCDLTVDDAEALVEGLQGHMKLLTDLRVAYNDISPLGAFMVSSVLPSQSGLGSLDMSHSSLDDECAANVAAGMKFMPSLKHLNLSQNCFGPQGSIALGYEMQHLTQLNTFDISDNCVGPTGALAIAWGITHCSKLKYLHMRNTSIDLNSALQIIQGLKQCPIETADLSSFVSPETHFCSNLIVVAGLISVEDEESIAALVTAMRHDYHNRTLDLGFDCREVKAKFHILAEFYYLYFRFLCR